MKPKTKTKDRQIDNSSTIYASNIDLVLNRTDVRSLNVTNKQEKQESDDR